MEERREEEWKQIPDYEGFYEASDFGRVRSVIDRRNTFAGKILKPSISNSGYTCVGLSKNGNKRSFLVHRLIIATFIGCCPNGKQVNHKDGDKTNSRLENLEYVTPHENKLHAFATGLESNKGENHSQSKLTKEDIYEIRRCIGEETRLELAERFNVTRTHIGLIVRGKTWTHLKEPDDDLTNTEE